MASPGDILSALKNGVVNMAALAQSFYRSQGTATSSAIAGGASPTATLVYSGSGYLVNFSVISVSSSTTANGKINNAGSTTSVTTSNTLCSIPNVVGVFQCNLVFTNGLVVTPSANQTVAVTYYPTPATS